MLHQLFNFFFDIVFGGYASIDQAIMLTKFTILGYEFTFRSYFSFICTIISLVFIVVLCCLFVYKIIKLIGGLIR